MATENVNQSEKAAIDQERANLGLRATWETSALLEAIEREITRDDPASDDFVVPLLLRRATAVNGLAMIILGGHAKPSIEEIRAELDGEAGMEHV